MTNPPAIARNPSWTLAQLDTEYDHLRKPYLDLLEDFNTKDEEHEKRISALEASTEASRKELEEQRKASDELLNKYIDKHNV